MSGRYWDSSLDKKRHRRDVDYDDDRRNRRRRSRSRDRDYDRHRRRRSRSYSRSSRSRSNDRRHRHKSHRSSSKDRHREDRHKNGTKTGSKVDNNNEKSTESTQDGYEFASKFKTADDNNTQYIGGVESEEERKKIHEQMQERLRKLQEAEPKRPTKPSSSTTPFTPFANDGSFLERFKQMQERFAQEQATQQKEDDRLRLLPMVGRRRGGKILKTGIVEKPKRIEENPADGPKDAWSLYLQEVKRYKNATCDPDAPSRSLVK